MSRQQEGEIHGGRSNCSAARSRTCVTSRQWDAVFFSDPSFYMPFHPVDRGSQTSGRGLYGIGEGRDYRDDRDYGREVIVWYTNKGV